MISADGDGADQEQAAGHHDQRVAAVGERDRQRAGAGHDRHQDHAGAHRRRGASASARAARRGVRSARDDRWRGSVQVAAPASSSLRPPLSRSRPTNAGPECRGANDMLAGGPAPTSPGATGSAERGEGRPVLSAYSRVTVVGDGRAVDLALPSGLPLADVVPQVLRFCAPAEGIERPEAWTLARLGGPVLALGSEPGRVRRRRRRRARAAAVPAPTCGPPSSRTYGTRSRTASTRSVAPGCPPPA